MSDATVLLVAVERGDPKAADELLELVYDELRHLAATRMAQQLPGQTIQATALVHEAWLRLVGDKNPRFKDRTHFFAAAAEAMRHILIDRARRKQAARHGGLFKHVSFEEFEVAAPGADDELLAMHELLEAFSLKYPIQAELVKLRYFVGMTNQEASEVLGISVSTANNYWNFSRAWLFKELRSQLKSPFPDVRRIKTSLSHLCGRSLRQLRSWLCKCSRRWRSPTRPRRASVSNRAVSVKVLGRV